MARPQHQHAPGLNQPPGALVYVGPKRDAPIEIHSLVFDGKTVAAADHQKLKTLPEPTAERVSWFDFDGVHDPELIARVGERFAIHPLLLEDILDTGQRPKAETETGQLFFALKMVRYLPDRAELDIEQVSLVLTKTYVLSFQEKTGDVFDQVRSRIIDKKGIIRQRGTDYLFYSLIDAVVDHYFLVLEGIGDVIEALEEEVFEQPDERSLARIQRNKTNLLHLRKSVYPLRESLSRTLKEGGELIDEATLRYVSDAYEHTVQIIETIESYRDINSGLKDIYLSSISLRMNQVMQTLTAMASIFIPLTFIAGVYGMNFQHIPELALPYAYPVFWLVCLGISLILFIYFRAKKWI